MGNRGLRPPAATAASPAVRFTPESGHQFSTLGCPLCAMSGHAPPGAFNLTDRSNSRIVKIGSVEALLKVGIDRRQLVTRQRSLASFSQ